jgi:hypothetical protein
VQDEADGAAGAVGFEGDLGIDALEEKLQRAFWKNLAHPAVRGSTGKSACATWDNSSLPLDSSLG